MELVLLGNQRLMPFDVTQLIVVLTNLSHQKTLESGRGWGWGNHCSASVGSPGSPFLPPYLVLFKTAGKEISESSLFNPPSH